MKSCFLGALIIVTMMFGSADICAATMTDTKKAAVSQALGPVLPYQQMEIEENKLLGGGTYGVEVDPNAQGEVILLDNQFEDFPKGDVSNEGSLHLKQTQNRKSRKILIGIGISALVFILSAVFLSKYIRLRKKQSIL